MSQTNKSYLIADQRPNNKAVGTKSTEDVPSLSTPSDARDQSPGVQHPDISPRECLLAALWRSPDRCHLLGTLDRETGIFKNVPVNGVADAVAQAQNLSSGGLEVYFACAEYLNPDSRVSANASGAYAFWLDIDCGAENASAGKGYPTIDDAEAALSQFCTDAGLPLPTHIVHSGGGLHAYWVLNREIPREMWLAYAKKFKGVAKACTFLADPSRTADIASVLRVPGTKNHKFTPPRPVSLRYASAEFVEASVMLGAIEAAHDRLRGAVMVSTRPGSTSHVASNDADVCRCARPDLDRLASALAMLDPDCDEEPSKLRRLAPLALAAHDHPELSTEPHPDPVDPAQLLDELSTMNR